MTLPPDVAAAIAELYRATAWVEGLPLNDMPDDAHRDYDCWRIYARDVRAVRAARQKLYLRLAEPWLAARGVPCSSTTEPSR